MFISIYIYKFYKLKLKMKFLVNYIGYLFIKKYIIIIIIYDKKKDLKVEQILEVKIIYQIKFIRSKNKLNYRFSKKSININ